MCALPLITEGEDGYYVSNPLKKRNNLKVKIIKYLHREGSKSIPDLCVVARVSAPTLKRIMVELVEEGLVLDLGLGDSAGGRRPSVYGLNPNSRYILGIDISRFKTSIGLFNLSCETIGDILVIPDGLETGADVVGMLRDQIGNIFRAHSIDRELVLGVGIAIPGLIDIKTGISYSYFYQDDLPVQQYLSDQLQLPVFIEHDTRAIARGELHFGHARGKQNVLCLNLGSGIGLSMILNGQLYLGESGYAGEFGHINIDPNGQLCYCGKIGCLETMASGRTIRKLVNEDLLKGTKTLIRDLVSNNLTQVDLQVIIRAAAAGDQYAIGVLSEAAAYIGKGISTLIHLFNPELIILGGMLSRAGKLLVDPVQQNLNTHCIPRIRQDTNLVLSDLGEKAGILGTVALVMDKVFVTGKP